jgi:hypothetical protein
MAGVVETTNTFATNDVITSTAMNNIIDQTLFTSDAIAAGNATLALVAGKLKVGTITSNEMGVGAVTANALASNAVTTVKITDANVTTDKIADSAVTTAKILDASVTPAKLSQPLTLETAKATTSGTSIDFTGIPSWVKRITVMFGGVSTSGTSIPMIQLGNSSGIEATGYAGSAGFVTGAGSNAATYTDGFRLNQAHAASTVFHGNAVLALLSSASNTWAMSFVGAYSNSGVLKISGGSKSLSDDLTQVRLTTVNGTDTFDAGSVNIMYE